ncbi:MAG: TrkA family potassium uptake protein [Clostridia bacterium]|nr:TrkA family potassium uptake protein [Clostridia bacterium]
MKSFAVIGLGRFGSRLAVNLYNNGADVIAIDIDGSCVDKIGDSVTQAVVADACDLALLKKLGVDSCDYAIVAIGSNLGVSTLVTMNLSELGIENIICKASNSTHKTILEKLGAKQVFIPEHEFADRLALSLISSDKSIMDFIELSDEYAIDETEVPGPWAGKRVGDINIRAKHGVNIIGIRHGDDIDVQITPDTVLDSDAVLILLGTYDALRKVSKL